MLTLLSALWLVLCLGLGIDSLQCARVIEFSYPRKVNGLYSRREWSAFSGAGFVVMGMADYLPQDAEVSERLRRLDPEKPHWSVGAVGETGRMIEALWASLRRMGVYSGQQNMFGGKLLKAGRYLEVPYWLLSLVPSVTLLILWRKRRNARVEAAGPQLP